MQTQVRRLTVPDLDRLAELCGLFSSDHVGERANAAAMADRFLRDRGLRWLDVLGAVAQVLTPFEQNFCSNLSSYRNAPSDKQQQMLKTMLDTMPVGGAGAA